MKKISLPKATLGVLLMSIPLNIIVFSGLGNVYLSTTIIFSLFASLLFLTHGKIVARKSSISGIIVFVLLALFTIINVVFKLGEGIKIQVVFTIIYFQSLLVFLVTNYAFEKIKLSYVFKLFLGVAILVSLRMAIDDFSNLFNFSSVRGERIEANFAGGVNNFAILMGIALIISFFYIQKKWLKWSLAAYFFIIIVLTMSRGALFSLVLTFLIVALYDSNTKTLQNLLKISLSGIIVATIAIFYFDKMDVVLETFQDRFLIIFNGEATLKEFGSGRTIILFHIIENHFAKANLFEILFGHGMGSIDFSVNGSPYESSHNIFMDILFRNGLLFLLMYMSLFVYILLKFFRLKKNRHLALFGLFVFIHLGIIVNPFLFAVQAGWIYIFYMMIFIVFLKPKSPLQSI